MILRLRLCSALLGVPFLALSTLFSQTEATPKSTVSIPLIETQTVQSGVQVSVGASARSVATTTVARVPRKQPRTEYDDFSDYAPPPPKVSVQPTMENSTTSASRTSMTGAAKTEKTSGAKTSKAAASPALKPAAKEILIPGVHIPRKDGRLLSLRTVNGCFSLSFYDAEKKELAPDAIRATAKWKVNNKKSTDTCVLSPAGDGKSLVGNKFVAPPRIFKVYLTLIDSQEKALESFVVDFRDK